MKLLRKLEWILFQAPNQQGQVDIILVSDTFQKTIKKDKKNVPGIIVAKISFKKSYRASQPLRTPVPSLHIWVPPSLFRGIVKNNVINSTVLYFDVFDKFPFLKNFQHMPLQHIGFFTEFLAPINAAFACPTD